MKNIRLVISVDVEEEGLFSGRYEREPDVKNVARLVDLQFVTTEYGIPLTLLVGHPVMLDSGNVRLLQDLHLRQGAELGAHLHHWNTPPFTDHNLEKPVLSDDLPGDILERKLISLLGLCEDRLGVTPRAFRMGRFDLGSRIRELLPGHGILVDSSLVPLRTVPGETDHFLVPPDPHWLTDYRTKGPLYEVPLTCLPLIPGLVKPTYALARILPEKGGRLVHRTYRQAMLLGVHPAWQPLFTMRMAARRHIARGGQVVNMFLHSSEIAPGMSPASAGRGAAANILKKIRLFISWLKENYRVEGSTLTELLPRTDL